MPQVRENSRGIAIAALIVIANFVVVLQVTGVSYGRFQWAALGSPYDTPTSTPTATQTPTPQPDGGACTSGTQCVSTFCADGVCCDTRCDQLNRSCNLPGQVGTCAVIPAAPAPALSGGGLAAGVALLIVIAALALRVSRRRHRIAH